MITLILLTFVDLFVFIFTILLLVRVVSSYFADPHSGFYQGLVGVTEPVLAPIRRLLPPMAGLDVAPLAAFFLLQALQYLLHALVR